MTLYILLNSKKKLLFWALSPLAALILYYFLLVRYLDSVSGSMKTKKSFAESLPELNRRIRVAENILQYYKPVSIKAEAVETLNSQLNHMAKHSNFPLNTLSVEKDKEKGAAAADIFTISLRGEGAFPDIINFLDTIYSSKKLFFIETAKISVVRADADSAYTADLTFSYQNVR